MGEEAIERVDLVGVKAGVEQGRDGGIVGVVAEVRVRPQSAPPLNTEHRLGRSPFAAREKRGSRRRRRNSPERRFFLGGPIAGEMLEKRGELVYASASGRRKSKFSAFTVTWAIFNGPAMSGPGSDLLP